MWALGTTLSLNNDPYIYQRLYVKSISSQLSPRHRPSTHSVQTLQAKNKVLCFLTIRWKLMPLKMTRECRADSNRQSLGLGCNNWHSDKATGASCIFLTAGNFARALEENLGTGDRTQVPSTVLQSTYRVHPRQRRLFPNLGPEESHINFTCTSLRPQILLP